MKKQNTVWLLCLAFILILLRIVASNASYGPQAITQRPRLSRLGDKVTISWEATDADLVVLKTMQGIRVIEAQVGPNNFRPQITDAGLANLEGLTSLEALYLSDAKITDAGIAHLRGLKRLRVLQLDFDYDITDVALAYIGRLKELRILTFYGARITDSGLASLKHSTKCRCSRRWI